MPDPADPADPAGPSQALTLPGTDAPTLARKGVARAKSRRPAPPTEPAPDLPVAQVVIDSPLPHLDRTFDYLVTAKQDESVVAGCRVRVRFAGQLLDGFVLQRAATSTHDGPLTPISKVVSSEPVLANDIADLARAVADRYAGTLADVLRLAIPPRHAAVEKQVQPDAEVDDEMPAGSNAELIAGSNEALNAELNTELNVKRTGREPWEEYANGATLLDALRRGRAVRAVWSALPGQDWPDAIAAAVEASHKNGRGCLVVVPDKRDVDRVDRALSAVLGEGHHVVLTADLGPRERYRRWLSIRRGTERVVVGTRGAAFAPVRNLGLTIVWDDGDDLHAEPRAPYPHVREVLALRSLLHDVGLIVGGFARTAEGASLVSTGFARSLVPVRATVRGRAPRVRASDDGTSDDPVARAARLPHLAWRTAKSALEHGPVLVQVPRGGYVPAVACARCRTRAQCAACQGPLTLSRAGAVPACRWCGTPATAWRCQECGNGHLQALVVGARRTAEELGQAFPGVSVITSGGNRVLASVSTRPALVICTPGAEPLAAEGYAAALLLDTWALLGRLDLRANEETLRRWMAAASLVRPAADGGQIVVVADSALRPVQALVRWDPVGHAVRELQDRTEVGLPPAQRVAVLTGVSAAVTDVLSRAQLPSSATVLGPTAYQQDQVRTLIKVPRSQGLLMADALHRAAGERSARKEAAVVNIRLDPQELG